MVHVVGRRLAAKIIFCVRRAAVHYCLGASESPLCLLLWSGCAFQALDMSNLHVCKRFVFYYLFVKKNKDYAKKKYK